MDGVDGNVFACILPRFLGWEGEAMGGGASARVSVAALFKVAAARGGVRLSASSVCKSETLAMVVGGFTG